MRRFLIASTALIALSLPSLAAAADASQTIGSMTRKDLEAFIKQYLMDNPDLITDAMQNMRKKQMEEMKAKAEKSLKRNQAALNNDPASPSIGDPKKTDVTVVEFFDYHCGYCKHMLPVISKIMKEDPKVRFVFKEFPILSEDSVTASKAALAVWNLDKTKYFDYYTELMKYTGRFDEKTVLEFAAKYGISKDKMLKEMESDAVKDQLKKNRELAMDMEIRGTPAFIAGENFIPGAVDEDQLRDMIKAAREGKKLPTPTDGM